MAAGTGTRPGTGEAPLEEAHRGKAARLRRLWRSQDTRVQSSGLARARPAPAAPAALSAQGALLEQGALPSRGLTARELINMARAARTVPSAQG